MKRLLVVALALITSGAVIAAAQQTAAPTQQMTKPQTSTQHAPAPVKHTETKHEQKHEGVGKREQKHEEGKKHKRAKKRAQAKKHEAKGSAQTE